MARTVSVDYSDHDSVEEGFKLPLRDPAGVNPTVFGLFRTARGNLKIKNRISAT